MAGSVNNISEERRMPKRKGSKRPSFVTSAPPFASNG